MNTLQHVLHKPEEVAASEMKTRYYDDFILYYYNQGCKVDAI